MNVHHLFAKHECKMEQSKILVKDYLNGNASVAKSVPYTEFISTTPAQPACKAD